MEEEAAWQRELEEEAILAQQQQQAAAAAAAAPRVHQRSMPQVCARAPTSLRHRLRLSGACVLACSQTQLGRQREAQEGDRHAGLPRSSSDVHQQPELHRTPSYAPPDQNSAAAALLRALGAEHSGGTVATPLHDHGSNMHLLPHVPEAREDVGGGTKRNSRPKDDGDVFPSRAPGAVSNNPLAQFPSASSLEDDYGFDGHARRSSSAVPFQVVQEQWTAVRGRCPPPVWLLNSSMRQGYALT